MSLPPPPPPPGQVPPPSYQPYGHRAAPADHPQGTAILVLGILSLVVCGLLGPVAWGMGNRAVKEMDAQPATVFGNRGSVTAGRICGIISSVLLIVIVALGIVALVLAAARSSGN